MPELYFGRFHIADFALLGPEQKTFIKSMIVSHINIGNPLALKANLDLIGTFGDRAGLCLMDGKKPFGFVYADSSAVGENGKILKMDYIVCPISKSKKDFIRSGASRNIDPMLELAKSAILWGIERNCVGVVFAEPVSIGGNGLLKKLISQEYVSAKSKLILRDRFESHWEESNWGSKDRQNSRNSLIRTKAQAQIKTNVPMVKPPVTSQHTGDTSNYALLKMLAKKRKKQINQTRQIKPNKFLKVRR